MKHRIRKFGVGDVWWFSVYTSYATWGVGATRPFKWTVPRRRLRLRWKTG